MKKNNKKNRTFAKLTQLTFSVDTISLLFCPSFRSVTWCSRIGLASNLYTSYRRLEQKKISSSAGPNPGAGMFWFHVADFEETPAFGGGNGGPVCIGFVFGSVPCISVCPVADPVKFSRRNPDAGLLRLWRGHPAGSLHLRRNKWLALFCPSIFIPSEKIEQTS